MRFGNSTPPERSDRSVRHPTESRMPMGAAAGSRCASPRRASLERIRVCALCVSPIPHVHVLHAGPPAGVFYGVKSMQRGSACSCGKSIASLIATCVAPAESALPSQERRRSRPLFAGHSPALTARRCPPARGSGGGHACRVCSPAAGSRREQRAATQGSRRGASSRSRIRHTASGRHWPGRAGR